MGVVLGEDALARRIDREGNLKPWANRFCVCVVIVKVISTLPELLITNRKWKNHRVAVRVPYPWVHHL